MASKGELLNRRQALAAMAVLSTGALVAPDLLFGGRNIATAATSEPTIASTPEATPTAQLSPEVHNNLVNGLSFETYAVDTFVDITDKFSPEQQESIFKTLQDKGAGVNGQKNYISEINPASQTLFGVIPNPGLDLNSTASQDQPYREQVYFSSMNRRVIAGFGNPGSDGKLLGWSSKQAGYFDESEYLNLYPLNYGHLFDAYPINRFGKVMYGVSNNCRVAFQVENCAPNDHVLILADTLSNKKTIIRSTDGRNVDERYFQLSDSGNALLVYTRYDKTKPAEIDVLSLQDWSLIGHYTDPKLTTFTPVSLGGNGTKIMITTYRGGGPNTSSVIDIKTGKELESFIWETPLSGGGVVASPSLDYAAETVGMSASNKTEGGQWGVLVKTPHGFEWITSPKVSYRVDRVLDDGTVVCFEDWFVKPDNNGKYARVIIKGKEYPLSLEGYSK